MPLLFVDHNLKGDSAMPLRTWPTTTLALLATFAALWATQASRELAAPPDGLPALDGEWIYVEDRTEGRTLEQLGPAMTSKFSLRVEEGAVILNGHGSGHRDVRVALDGSITEVKEPKTIVRYRGAWKDGAFEYEVKFERLLGNPPEGIGLIRRKFRMTDAEIVSSHTVKYPYSFYALAKDVTDEDLKKRILAKVSVLTATN